MVQFVVRLIIPPGYKWRIFKDGRVPTSIKLTLEILVREFLQFQSPQAFILQFLFVFCTAISLAEYCVAVALEGIYHLLECSSLRTSSASSFRLSTLSIITFPFAHVNCFI